MMWGWVDGSVIGGVIGGLLTVVAGGLAYWGALRAARRQVEAVRRAARVQVAAVEKQISVLQDERQETDRRRLSIVKWAVGAEGRRLQTAVDARKDRLLPSKPQFAPQGRRVEQFVIESRALLRGEREDMALLDIETQELLKKISSVLDSYNAQIVTAPLGKEGQPQIFQEALDLIARLGELAAALQAVAER